MSTRSGEAVVCPFCNYAHGDAWEWCTSEDAKRMNCDECGREFVYHAEFSVDYIARVPLSDRELAILKGAVEGNR